MPSTFRFGPPAPRPHLLTRPRLLRALLSRWETQVVAVVGGPGLGKTTLLGQAVAENALAPRGDDVWVGVEAADAVGDGLGRAVARALGVDAAAATAVAGVLWQRAPTAVCLLFDDVHLLPPGSDGARWLGQLVDQLPANAHVVLAGRSDPPLPLARLRAQGEAVVVSEDDLRFSDDELADFGARRGVAPERFTDTGGWPAMAELAASVEAHLAGAFVWEEVLEPLGAERLRVLAVVADLGGADDALAAAALGAPVDLEEALGGVPLVATGAGGWRVPHALWRTVAGIGLAADDRASVRRGAAAHLIERGRYDDAFDLVAEAELWELAPAVLRAGCVASERPTSGLLARWLARCPDDVRASSAGCLASALHAAAVTPADAVEPLLAAVALCRADDDIDAELAALAELGRVGWWQQDMAAVLPAALRVNELAETGHPLARGLAAFGQAVAADLAGDDDGVLAAMDSIEPGVLDAGWTASAQWLKARILLSTGRAGAALALVDAIEPTDPVMLAIVENLRAGALSAVGRVDDALALLPRAVELQAAAGVAHNRRLGLLSAVAGFAQAGDVATAQRYRRELGPVGDLGVPGALAAAALLGAEGDEDQAAAVLREAVAVHGLDQGGKRRMWRDSLALTYVLLPETRAHWDALDLGVRLRLSKAVVAARSGGRLDDLDVPDLQIVRSALPCRFAADLAIGLTAVGRPEGAVLLDVLGPAGRDVVRARAETSKPARVLLAAVPSPPPTVSDLAVLGPLVLQRDGQEVVDADLRRERVRTLLAFLVGHRSTTRPEITAALWPDLDERAAANNLRVTLNYLLRVLEPWRPAGEPSYLVRLDLQRVELVTDDALRLDVDAFDHHVDAAARAEADGTPSLALVHHLAATALYRGPLHAEVPDADWIDLDREHYRSRYVRSAVRAAQLLQGRGDLDDADATARAALAVDPWSEDAYAVLTATALSRGDRSAAHRHLERALATLADLGLPPSPALQQLRRRIRS